MNSYALSLNGNRLALEPARYRQQPFLDALQQAEHGRLTLVTPENDTLEFSRSGLGPSASWKLYDWQVLDDLLARGEMGLLEAYIQGRWESDHLPDLLTFGLMNTASLEKFLHGRPWYVCLTWLRQFFRRNSPIRSRENVKMHYDLGNDFYALWLDKGMTYSCALFEDDDNRSLEEAQAAKYRRILDKLGANPGDHILDIGCGWGGFAEAAACRDLRVTAITLSEEQALYVSRRLRRSGLSHRATVALSDYRKISGRFDHIVSIGMFEHVGEAYWRTYFETIEKHLKPGGKAIIQSITLDDHLFESLHHHTGFMEQIIFPGGMLPSKFRFCAAANQARLQCREIFAFGKDYVRTLQHWSDRFYAREKEVRAMGYDESFMRLWRFYLAACIASFASGRTDVMQAELMHVG